MDEPNRPITFVVPGDLHLTEPGLKNHRVALWMVDEVNQLIRPDFVQFIGDNVQDATDAQFELFGELCRRLAVPSQQIEFVADPTGRYTAVPMVHPAVTNTAFC